MHAFEVEIIRNAIIKTISFYIDGKAVIYHTIEGETLAQSWPIGFFVEPQRGGLDRSKTGSKYFPIFSVALFRLARTPSALLTQHFL